MIQPVQTDDALLADIHAARGEPERMHVWWLGQSGYLVKWQGQHLLIDPYLSDSLNVKYAAAAKPHERMTRIPAEPAQLVHILNQRAEFQNVHQLLKQYAKAIEPRNNPTLTLPPPPK